MSSYTKGRILVRRHLPKERVETGDELLQRSDSDDGANRKQRVRVPRVPSVTRFDSVLPCGLPSCWIWCDAAAIPSANEPRMMSTPSQRTAKNSRFETLLASTACSSRRAPSARSGARRIQVEAAQNDGGAAVI